MHGAGGITVVKLGGSLAASADLRAWLDAIASCAGHVVIVPGGGPFADAVRVAQSKMRFDDHAAHRMAVLAMEQFGCALASLHERFKIAASVAAIHRVLRAREVPVWAPAKMVFGATGIPESWDVTSDSLAAWLAGKIDAQRVMLVKKVAIGKEPVSLEDLVSRGVVDRAFPWFLRESGAVAGILGAADPFALAAAIDGAHGAGTRIALP
jgi:5-(aminomethyl)-3-furanmethanol phosphate kinase